MADTPFDSRRVMVLAGPTGSGKSELALRLASQLDAEIVCMDSMQLYRELVIGTARPSLAEQCVIPHHLFGEVSVTTLMTTPHYCELASAKIAEIQARGKLALMVGGTGLYLRALFEGLAPMPTTPMDLRQRLNLRLQKKGLPKLYGLLRRLDPRGAAHLHANDSQRIQRFLEVRLLSGQSILDHWDLQRKNTGPRPLVLGLQMDRSLLLNRLEARTHQWLESGWIEETAQLIKLDLFKRVLEIGPLGYCEIARFLRGTLTREQMISRIFIATRQYAKRQMTWFRKASYIQWFPFEPDSGYNVARVTDFIRGEMG